MLMHLLEGLFTLFILVSTTTTTTSSASEPLSLLALKDTEYALKDFCICEELGQGSFGTVYKAFNEKDGKTYIVKVSSKKKPGKTIFDYHYYHYY